MSQHYSPEFLDTQRQALLEQKATTESELAKIGQFDLASGSYMATAPEYNSGSAEGIGESSLESETAQTNMALVSDLETTLNDTIAALAKLDSGEYGRCESTGEWIDEDRLRAYPAARTIAGLDQA